MGLENFQKKFDLLSSEDSASKIVKFKRIFLALMLGEIMFLTGYDVSDNQAQAKENNNAHLPPQVDHNPALVDYVNQNLSKETQIAPEEEIVLKKESKGVYSFVASESMEITDSNFVKRMRKSLKAMALKVKDKDLGNPDMGMVFIAVPDDDAGFTRVFPNSTLSNWREKYGFFWVYEDDKIYLAVSKEALEKFLKEQGIKFETFTFPIK